MNIAVLVTCFNRKDKTIKCLKALKTQFAKTDFKYDIHLTDDGCTDGTVEAVLTECPNASIYKGGNLYWAGGMRLCWSGAIAKGGYDYYLLLNDDTYVNDCFVPDFLECHTQYQGDVIIAGAVCNSNGERTYGSYKIISKYPYRVKKMFPSGKPEEVSFSGANVLFVPARIVDIVGVFPSIYVHACADFDYCLRAIKHGFSVKMTSHYVGICEKDHTMMSKHELRSLTIKERYQFLMSPKGGGFRQWLFYQKEFFPLRLPFVILKAIKQILFG